MKNLLTISIGSNCGDRDAQVKLARSWLLSLLQDGVASSVYETPAVGYLGSPYMNCVVAGFCDRTVEELEKLCKSYEREHGRDELSRKEKRVPVDIDIVTENDRVLRDFDYRQRFYRIGLEECQAQSNS